MIGMRTLAILGTATLGAAALLAPAADAATPAHGPTGGGYVASPAHVTSARMVLRVPTIGCGPKSTTSIAAGIFGTVDDGSDNDLKVRQWHLAVVASCHGGTPRYRAVDVGTSPAATLAVHPGDRVELVQSDAQDYGIDDLTRGDGVGGGSAGGSGQPKPMLLAPVLFGVQVTGSVRRATHISVLQAYVSRTDLDQVKPVRQRQTRRGSNIVTPAGLRSPGAFGVTVERT